MKALERKWTELRQALGWKETLALALLGIALGFQFAVLRPMELRKARLEIRLDQAGKRSEETMRGVLPDGVADRLAAFYRFFSREEQLTDLLARLDEISRSVGVELRTGEYDLRKPEGPRLGQYQITLPVAGDYARIRAFAENALFELPTLSLDRISFRRKRVSDAQVEAEIRMTLYLPAS
jgi:hypothetical protein